MVNVFALSLVFTGALVLLVALLPILRLIGKLPSGPIRSRWYTMLGMIVLFVFGYFAYLNLFWQSHEQLIDLIVPVVFFMGGCFVWLTATLSMQTTVDVIRLSLLERESVTDPLTGVFNRRYLDRCLADDVASARRYNLPLSVLMIDIDHFKLVNDTHGHQFGDRVLATIGEIISKALRESDSVARYGGEEFLVIARHTPLEGATELAERLRTAIESHEMNLPGQAESLHVTVSIGVADLSGEIAETERLIHLADDNLYRAKEAGRNRTVAGLSATPQ